MSTPSDRARVAIDRAGIAALRAHHPVAMAVISDLRAAQLHLRSGVSWATSWVGWQALGRDDAHIRASTRFAADVAHAHVRLAYWMAWASRVPPGTLDHLDNAVCAVSAIIHCVDPEQFASACETITQAIERVAEVQL